MISLSVSITANLQKFYHPPAPVNLTTSEEINTVEPRYKEVGYNKTLL